MAVLGAWTAVAVSGASAFAAVPSRHLAVATRMQATATSPPAAQATRDAKPVQQQQPTDKTDGSAGAAAPAAKGKRRVMHCGVCGLPKKGHFCKGPPPMSDVPIRGSVRMHHGFDRRLRQPLPEKPKPAVLEVEDVPAVPPQADARDALEDPVIQMYNSWATDGRDLVMEITHEPAFDNMWSHLKKTFPQFTVTVDDDGGEQEGSGLGFTAVDAGCGNGWAARKIAQHPRCRSIVGVDAAALMVDRAEEIRDEWGGISDEVKSKLRFEVGDIGTWAPAQEADLITVCESIYFCNDPQAALSHMVSRCLKTGGVLAATVDCYLENTVSQRWEKDLGVPMHCKSQEEWVRVFEQAGLSDVKVWRCKDDNKWWPQSHSLRQGTLLLTGRKSSWARERESKPDTPLSLEPGSAQRAPPPPPASSRVSVPTNSEDALARKAGMYASKGKIASRLA